MRHYSKLSICFLFLSVLFLSSCGEEKDPFQAAKDKFFDSNYISFKESAFYPIPDSNMANMVVTDVEILFDKTDSVGYNFSQQRKGQARIYQDGIFRSVNEKLKAVRVYLRKDYGSEEQFIQGVSNSFMNKKRSPLGLFEQQWFYVKDTIMKDEKNYSNYYRLEQERTFEGGTIRTEQHIFISEDDFLTRFERRNYNNGSLVQRISVKYEDYVVDPDKRVLNYTVPEGYQSVFAKSKN